MPLCRALMWGNAWHPTAPTQRKVKSGVTMYIYLWDDHTILFVQHICENTYIRKQAVALLYMTQSAVSDVGRQLDLTYNNNCLPIACTLQIGADCTVIVIISLRSISNFDSSFFFNDACFEVKWYAFKWDVINDYLKAFFKERRALAFAWLNKKKAVCTWHWACCHTDSWSRHITFARSRLMQSKTLVGVPNVVSHKGLT